MGSYPTSIYNHQPTQVYSPSVPLTIYRDLAAELQTSQAALQEITRKNHILEQENQLLRQEIHKAVQSVLHLQNLINHPSVQIPHPGVKSSPPPKKVSPQRKIPPVAEQVFIEEEHYYPHTQPQSPEVSGWRLIIAILLIILTAFGVGYLFVRPILQQHSR